MHLWALLNSTDGIATEIYAVNYGFPPLKLVGNISLRSRILPSFVVPLGLCSYSRF